MSKLYGIDYISTKIVKKKEKKEKESKNFTIEKALSLKKKKKLLTGEK